ncbi:cyanate permease [Umezawaea tangerina]|uniref:Cyanate permease n=2 Tax=Umezawaea tangerina TaxID=84725 RepID=A0A2T0STJ8_9PSEU|nr:cyanate permease [Umezawaea tangerina]
MAVSAGPMVVSTLSLFVVPIAEDTGWSRTAVTAAFTSMALGQAVGTPVVGHLLDRFAFRWVVAPSWALYCACLALVTAVPRALPLFYGLFFLTGVFAGGTMIPFVKATLSWFDNRRGAAVGVTAAFAALGAATTPLLVSALLTAHGWRVTYRWLALVAFVVSLTAVFALVRVRAERALRGRLVKVVVADDRVVSLEPPGLDVRESLRDKHFWMIAVNLCATGVAVVGIQVSIVPMMLDQGVAPGRAASLLTVFGLASLLGRVVGGALLDRFHAPVVCAVVVLCPAVGVFLLHGPFASAAAGTALVGVAFGVEVDLLPFFVSRYLGMRRFGGLLGILQAAVMLTSAFGPPAVNLGRDVLGGYDAVLPWLAGLLVVCAALVLRLGPYRYPAVAGFDRVAARDELVEALRPNDSTPATRKSE